MKSTFLSILFLAGLLHAQSPSPRVIPFQAQVTDQDGALIEDGQYSVIFSLYDQAVGGTPVWSERHTQIGVTQGALNVFLGSIEALGSVNFSQAKYLGITVDVDNVASSVEPEMVPRSVIIPAFHAKTAENSTKLAGNDWSAILVGGSNDPQTESISGQKLENEGITKSKLASGSVGTEEVEDGSIKIEDINSVSLGKIVPVGVILPFGGPKNQIPDGWLYCDGRGFDRTTYPLLYDVIGQTWGGDATIELFHLPDLRGEFLRGSSDGTSRDPDRSSRVSRFAGGNTGDNVGTYQGHMFQAHTHTYDRRNSSVDDAAGSNSRTIQTSGPIVVDNTSAAGGDETRPRNATIYYIIKAF